VPRLQVCEREHADGVADGDLRREDAHDAEGALVDLESVADANAVILCRAPTEHHLVARGVGERTPRQQGDAIRCLVGCPNADLDEERMLRVDPTRLYECPDRALDSRRRSKRVDVLSVERAVEDVGDSALRDGEVGVAGLQDRDCGLT